MAKRRNIAECDAISDDDFQPTLYNKRPKRRKITKPIKKKLDSRTCKPAKTKLGKSKSNEKSDTKKNAQLRIVLPRLNLESGVTYSVHAMRQTLETNKLLENYNITEPAVKKMSGKHVCSQWVISLHNDNMTYLHRNIDQASNTCDIITDVRKRQIDEVIDHSDEEVVLVKGKPSRKKFKKDTVMSDSFNEAFYLSSSEDSDINTSSDEDIFVSSAEEEPKSPFLPRLRRRR